MQCTGYQFIEVMKRLTLFISLLLLAAVPASAQHSEVGTSSAVWGSVPTVEELRQALTDGIQWVEVAVNQCYRGVPNEEKYPRMKQMKERLDSAGMQVWSVHLPFSRQLDISVADSSLRAKNVAVLSKMIRWSCELYAPQRLVLHPSSEPIADSLRGQRLENAIASIRTLKKVADDEGVELCIENLPRTCLGNTPEELVRIVDAVPGVGICFDTNHYTLGTVAHFIEVAGRRIRTLHISDYDFVNECHWLPYEGQIDWGAFRRDLHEKAGYDGVLMYEVKKLRRDGSRTTTKALAESFHRMNDDFQQMNVN